MTERAPTSNGKVYKTHFKNQKDQELIRLALHRSAFFSCLDEEQLQRLVETAQLKTYQRGEIVILEGCVDDDDDDQDQDETIEMDHSISASSERSSAVAPTVEDDSLVDGPAEADDEFDVFDEEENDKNNGETVDAAAKSENKEETDTVNNTNNKESESTSRITGNAPSSGSEEKGETQNAENGALSNAEGKLPAVAEDLPLSTVFDENETIDCTTTDTQQDDDSSLSSTSPTPNAEKEQTSQAHPPPPRSGIPRYIYIVRKGHAGIWYQPNFSPASLGPGTLFGEGGFLFGRQHSASVVAADDTLECWVVDHDTFRHHVLPSSNMNSIFQFYAKDEDEKGELYMTMDDFVKAVTEFQTKGNGHPSMLQDSLVSLRIANTYSILRRNYNDVSSSVDPRIYLDDFAFFQFLMARPDPEVDIAFLLMDEKQTGQISLEDLAKFLQPVFPDLDLKSQFFQRYFGKQGKHSIRQTHFSQFLADLQREMGKQAFLRAVEERGTPQGYLNPSDFVQVLGSACGWRLPQGVTGRLEDIYCHGSNNRDDESFEQVADHPSGASALGDKIVPALTPSLSRRRNSNLGDKFFAYGDFLAFQEVLGNLPFICNLIDTAQEIKKGPLSPDDFKVANRVQGLGGRFSRRQVEIVFNLFDLDQDGYVSFEDTVTVCGIDYAQRLVPVKGRGDKLTFAPPPKYRHNQQMVLGERSLAEKVLAGLFHLGIATTVGGCGVGLLYPLDFVKTRLMNQRIALDGSRMYRSSLDCIQQAFRFEGFSGLYRGLLPSLLGVAPERAIKLQVHNLLIQAYSFDDDSNGFTSSNKRPSLWVEALAGGCAGASQLLVTNPIELAKIRLQLQGETSRLLVARGISPPHPPGFIEVIRDLGFPGIYRGASACLLRDVPFSALYFPAYSACKDALSNANSLTGAVSSSDILLAGTIAAIPAAFLTTPADVIKTRLQVVPRPGEASYVNLGNCATQMYRREGLGAFFQGSMMRTLRIAPQFGISMLAYEGLAELFGFQRTSRPPTNLPLEPRDYQQAFGPTS